MSAAHHLGEQLQLFRPQGTRAATDGDKPALDSFESFVARPSTKFHGTFREDWEDAPTAHFGTRGQATQRLHNVARGIKEFPSFRGAYYSGGDDDTPDDYEPDYDEEDQPVHTGRIYARQLPNPAPRHDVPFTDHMANRADYMYHVSLGKEDWEIPKSIRESAAPTPESWMPPSEKMAQMKGGMWPNVADAYRALSNGQRIDYTNSVEAGSVFESRKTGSGRAKYDAVSSIARPANTGTWEEERINDPNTSSAGKAFAQQRIDQHTASTVPFESNDYDFAEQGLIGGGARWAKPSKESVRNLSMLQFKTSD